MFGEATLDVSGTFSGEAIRLLISSVAPHSALNTHGADLKCVSSDLIRQCSWFSEAGAGGRDAVLTKSRDRGPPFGVRRPR